MRVTASSKHGACTQTVCDGSGVGAIGGGVVSQAPAHHLEVIVTSEELLRSTQHSVFFDFEHFWPCSFLWMAERGDVAMKTHVHHTAKRDTARQ